MGFEDRHQLTKVVEEKLTNLFCEDKVCVHEFGFMTIARDNQDLISYIKEPCVNQESTAMIVKFAPDFILLKKDKPQRLFFLDVKHSISPIYADTRLNDLRNKIGDDSLNKSDIGVIAREALLAYRRFYPETIILMASPYNSKLLMAQFAENVKCLYCYKDEKTGYDCKECPTLRGGFFDIGRNYNSKGSKTPHTNVDLRSFKPAKEFFDEINIEINENELSKLCEMIKDEEILFDESVFEQNRNKTRCELAEKGHCKWIKYKVYGKKGNDLIHINKECFGLKTINGDLIEYDSFSSVCEKTIKCKICSNGL